MNDTNWDEVMGLIDDDLAKLDQELELCDEQATSSSESAGTVVDVDARRVSEVSSGRVSMDSGITAIAVEVVGQGRGRSQLVDSPNTNNGDNPPFSEDLASTVSLTKAEINQPFPTDENTVEPDVEVGVSDVTPDIAEGHSISPSLDEVSVSTRVDEYERSSEDIRRRQDQSAGRSEYGRTLGTRKGAQAIPSTSSSCKDVSEGGGGVVRNAPATSGLPKTMSYRDVVNDATYRELEIPEVVAGRQMEPRETGIRGVADQTIIASGQSVSCRSIPRKVEHSNASRLDGFHSNNNSNNNVGASGLLHSTRSLSSSTHSTAYSTCSPRNPIKTGSSRSLSSSSRSRIHLRQSNANSQEPRRQASQERLARSLQDIGAVKVMLTSSNDPDRGSAVYTQVKRRHGNVDSGLKRSSI